MQRPRLTTPPSFQERLLGVDLVHNYYHPPGPKRLALKMLGKDAPLIRRGVMIAAFEKNPYSGVVALDHDGEAIGFFEAWAIYDDALTALLREDITDDELEVRDFMPLPEVSGSLYVGMTVPLLRADGRKTVGGLAMESLLGLLYAATRLFESVYLPFENKGGLQLFAIAETRNGKNLLEDLGFQRDERSFGRSSRPAYRRVVTRSWIDQLRSDYRLTAKRFNVAEKWPVVQL
jgi:hypothetical protein